MTGREMQRNFGFELQERDPSFYLKNKLNSNKIFYYLSRYQMDYINDLYGQGPDMSEANKAKLGKMFVQSIITGGSITSNANYSIGNVTGFDVVKPADLLYPLNQRGVLSSGETDVEVEPISYDFYNVNKENPFRKPTTVKLWRLDSPNSHIVMTNGGTLTSYYLDYIKMPTDIDLINDCKLDISTHWNVVKGAVKLLLGAKNDQTAYQIQTIEEKKI